MGEMNTTYPKLGTVIKNHNISIEPDADVSLRPLQPHLLRCVATAPPHNLLNAEILVAPCAFGPQDGKAETHARDAAPGTEEIALFLRALLHLLI